MSDRLVALYTDFGHAGPYVGQVRAVLAAAAAPAIDLMHDAPAFSPKPAAYLLAALVAQLPARAVVCAVVDPGVGSDRPALALEADDRWLVGPGNDLLEIAARRAATVERHRIAWRPSRLSASFHGRDLFAPVAARLAVAEQAAVAEMLRPAGGAEPSAAADWPDDLAEIVYIDGYGNAMTGVRADRFGAGPRLRLAGRRIPWARTFSDVSTGQAFCYENAIGLIEIAVNQGSSATTFGLSIGTPVDVGEA